MRPSRLLLIGIAAAEFAAGQTQTVGLLINDAAKVAPGYILMSPSHNTPTYLIDNNGQVINSWTVSSYQPNQMAYLLPNGHLLRSDSLPKSASSSLAGQFSEYDWQGNLVWRFAYSDSNYVLHHDFKRLPNGNVIVLAMETKTQAQALAAGFRPEVLPNSSFRPDAVVEIQPILPSGGQIVWEWHVWDHLVQNYDSTKSNYGAPSAHPELVDPNVGYPQKIATDWNHMNAIDYNASLDQILLSVRNNSEVWVIDHSTTAAQAAGHTDGKYGKGGDLLYRWGNPAMYGAGRSADQVLYQQHDAQWIPPGLPGEGRIMAFNNGINRIGGNYSSADEFGPTVDAGGNYPLASGAAWSPAKPDWTYFGTGSEQYYETTIGGVQRLPNGNTIICYGAFGVIEEVTAAGELVWKYVNPVQASGSAILKQGQTPDADPNQTTAYMNSVFKVRKYAPDYAGLSGQDLTPKGTIETYAVVGVNGASLLAGATAPGAVLSLSGTALADSTAVATTTPPPTALGGATVTVKDSAGTTLPCPLIYASPVQINLVIPETVATGAARLTVARESGGSQWANIAIEPVAPGLFSMNGNGKGAAIVDAVRVSGEGLRTGLQAFSYDPTGKQFVSLPLDLGAASDQVNLSLYGAGVRGFGSLSAISVTIGGVAVPVLGVSQSALPGVDLVNVGPLPRTLAGKGEVSVALRVSGRTANTVTVNIK
jgi:uncharacterized protein (TIGR03437 family)